MNQGGRSPSLRTHFVACYPPSGAQTPPRNAPLFIPVHWELKNYNIDDKHEDYYVWSNYR